MLSLGCSYICFASASQMIGYNDSVLAPVKLLAGMVVSKLTYAVSSGTLNLTIACQLVSFKFIVP